MWCRILPSRRPCSCFCVLLLSVLLAGSLFLAGSATCFWLVVVVFTLRLPDFIVFQIVVKMLPRSSGYFEETPFIAYASGCCIEIVDAFLLLPIDSRDVGCDVCPTLMGLPCVALRGAGVVLGLMFWR